MCKYLSGAIDPTESDSNWSQAQQCQTQRFHETFATVFSMIQTHYLDPIFMFW